MTGTEGAGNTAPEVNGRDFLEAIRRHDQTIDTDFAVAARMLLDGAIDTTGAKLAIAPDDVADSVITLIDLGFLEEIVSIDAGNGCEDRLLALRLPEPAQLPSSTPATRPHMSRWLG